MNQYLNYLKEKPLVRIGVPVALGILGILTWYLVRQAQIVPSDQALEDVRRVQLKDQTAQLTIDEDGIVEYLDPQNRFYQIWDEAKVAAVFRRLDKQLAQTGKTYTQMVIEKDGGGYQVSLTNSSGSTTELTIEETDKDLNQTIEEIDDLTESSGTFDTTTFASPSPELPGPQGGGSGGDGGTNQIPECPFWRLSYCVFPPGELPQGGAAANPSPTPTPSPVSDSAQRPADCSLWEYQLISRGVISNTLCIHPEVE